MQTTVGMLKRSKSFPMFYIYNRFSKHFSQLQEFDWQKFYSFLFQMLQVVVFVT